MTKFSGEQDQIQCCECESIVENIDDELCEHCKKHFCMGCFDSHDCNAPQVAED